MATNNHHTAASAPSSSSSSSSQPPAVTTPPSIPLKVRLLCGIATAVQNACLRGDGTAVNRRLLSLIALRVSSSSTPDASGVSSSDHRINNHLHFRLFSPSGTAEDTVPVIVYFHGGGFIFNSAFSSHYDHLCRRIAASASAKVVSVEYRLAPEHRYPAAYDDGVEVLRWLDTAEELFPANKKKIAVFLAGDSAGGNIAHNVARRVVVDGHGFRLVEVSGVVGLQPFFGGEERTESERRLDGATPFSSVEAFEGMWKAFLPVGSDRNHECSNVFGAGAGMTTMPEGFPPVMVVVGGWDPLQDRQRLYAEGMRNAGVDVTVKEYPDGFHGFFAFSGELPEARMVIDDMAAFVGGRAASLTT